MDAVPFLGEKSEATEDIAETPRRSQIYRIPNSERKCWIYCVASLLGLNVLLLWLWQAQVRAAERCIRPKLSFSPAKSAISYEKRTLYRDINQNRFSGPPRQEQDEAWHNLLSPMVIRISEAELNGFGGTSIKLKDGSGYISELAVYHELHCIKRLRRHLAIDRYYPNLTESERVVEGRHMGKVVRRVLEQADILDHCLEYWREAAMCRGDTTLSGFYWKQGVPTSTQYSTHECVNWEGINAWAESRRVDLIDYSQLES